MYIRLHNSCTYSVFSNYFEIRSDLFGLCFKIKNITEQQSSYLMEQLQNGISEITGAERIATELQCDSIKIKNIIDFLREKSILIRCKLAINHEIKNTLYDRQIRFFDSFETELCNGYNFNKKLQNRKIIIVGLGGYGSWLALHCARLGIKYIVGIDFDKIELSNLPRQILYTQQHINEYKSRSAARLLTTVDPHIKYESHTLKITSSDDLIPLLENADLVFNAFGYYPENEAKNSISGFINQACIITKTPMLCLSTTWLGPFYLPQQSACYFCTVNHSKIKPILLRNKRNPRVDKRAFGPLLAMTCSLAVFEATQYLSGIKHPSTFNGIYTLDPFQMNKSKFINIEPASDCKYCRELCYA